MWWAVASTQHIAGKDAGKDACWCRAGRAPWEEAGSFWVLPTIIIIISSGQKRVIPKTVYNDGCWQQRCVPGDT